MEDKKLIQFRNIVKEFDGQMVLKGIDLDIYENEFVTLLGPSGCGKTTLLRILGGFIEADEGKIIFDGEDIGSVPPYKRELNTVFQKYALFPHMTVEQNISYVPNLLNKRDKEKTKNAVSKWMKIVGLSEDLKHRYPSELSGGQQQRVGIARALAASPDILLMDEPFGAVDEITRGQLQTELKRIHSQTGITVLFVTHDISEALKLGTKVLVMNSGKIEQFAKPEELLHHPATEFVKELVKRERRTCYLPEEQLSSCLFSGAADERNNHDTK